MTLDGDDDEGLAPEQFGLVEAVDRARFVDRMKAEATISRPMISLTSSRVGTPAVAYEWNPSANGSLRTARDESSLSAIGPRQSAPEATSSMPGLGYLGSTSASGSAGSTVSGPEVSSDPGESPLLANWLARRFSSTSLVSDPDGAAASGASSAAELAPTASTAGALGAQVAFASPSAVPEPTAILSTLLGLGIAAFGTSRSRASIRRRIALPA